MTAIADLPDIRPSLLLDFANSGRVDPRIQCTRASSATCYGPDGKLRVVPANTPRIDYDPETGKCLGLLVEESRTNLVYPSVIPSGKGVVFGKVQLNGNTTAVSGIPSPDGSNNAVSITGASNSTNSSGMDNLRLLAVIPLENVGYSVSFYLKSAVTVTVREASSGTNVSFAPSSKWTRVSAVFTPTSPNQNIIITSAGGAEFSLFGLQVEVGSFPTSYIPTEASAVTRAADFVQMTGANFSSWYRQDEGTLFADYVLGEKLNNSRAVSLAGTGADRIDIVSGTSAGTGAYGEAVVSGVVQAAKPQAITNTPNSRFRLAFAYRKDDCNGARNGSVSTDVTSAAIPAVSTLTFGSSQSGSNSLCGHIRRVIFYARRLPNNQLQRLTA